MARKIFTFWRTPFDSDRPWQVRGNVSCPVLEGSWVQIPRDVFQNKSTIWHKAMRYAMPASSKNRSMGMWMKICGWRNASKICGLRNADAYLLTKIGGQRFADKEMETKICGWRNVDEDLRTKKWGRRNPEEDLQTKKWLWRFVDEDLRTKICGRRNADEEMQTKICVDEYLWYE